MQFRNVSNTFETLWCMQSVHASAFSRFEIQGHSEIDGEGVFTVRSRTFLFCSTLFSYAIMLIDGDDSEVHYAQKCIPKRINTPGQHLCMQKDVVFL